MTDREQPQYFSQSQLARHFDVSRTAIANWRVRWPCDNKVLPTPAPDAFVGGRPMWLQSSLPLWEAWRARHVAMWGNRMEHPRGTRRKVQVPAQVVVGVDNDEAEQNQKQLGRMLHNLYARAGWPPVEELADRTGLAKETIRKALKNTVLPERQTVIALTTALDGDAEAAAALWARSRPARRIDGGWLSRVLSVVHGKVLQLAAVGCTAEDTAQAMGWTLAGVQDYWDDITERLRVPSMDEAVSIALETGYLTRDPDGVITLTVKNGGKPKQGGEHGYLLYKVASDLRTKFADAPPGTFLGTMDQLSAEYTTSETTISSALKMLKAEGVVAGGGKGHPFVVADREKERDGHQEHSRGAYQPGAVHADAVVDGDEHAGHVLAPGDVPHPVGHGDVHVHEGGRR